MSVREIGTRFWTGEKLVGLNSTNNPEFVNIEFEVIDHVSCLQFGQTVIAEHLSPIQIIRRPATLKDIYPSWVTDDRESKEQK